jgi:hypothetical protein
MNESSPFRRPSRREPSQEGTCHILNHDAFLFYELEDEFSYQHNSRGVFAFIEGTFDLPNTLRHDQRVNSLAQYLTILKCAQQVANLEHTSNWDIFMIITMMDGTEWYCYDDAKLIGDPDFLKESLITELEVTAAPQADIDEEDFDWDSMLTRQLKVDDIAEIHLWFDT